MKFQQRLFRPIGFLAISMAWGVMASSAAMADVRVTPRHLMILREGLDTVYGSYIFAVENSSDKPEHFKSPLMLPKEADDFSPQEGVEASDLSLAPGGGVIIEKDFAPGMQVVSVGFRVPARYGRGLLSLTAGLPIESFTLLVPRQSGILATSPKLVLGDASNAPDPQYEPFITSTPLQPGDTLAIDVAGLPEGRTRSWIVGGGVAAMLLAMAGFLAWRTRPKISGDGASTVLIG